MRTTTLMLGVPALALLAFAQADREAQTTTTEKTRTETKTENMMSSKKLKGILVDANCSAAGAGTSSRTTTETSSSADRSASEASSGKDTGSASRWQSCPVTANTTAFGLVTADGRMLRFDDVGNSRAAEAVKSHTKWTTSNKPPKVKVHGVTMGETLQVQEIR